MKHIFLSRYQFPIAHTGDDIPLNHAHVLYVSVESLLRCDTAVRAVLDEFQDRNITEMMPGKWAVPEVVAAYLHERLSSYSVQTITVWFDDIGARLEF